MPSIQIKDVPEETHTVLRTRAAAAGKSLQEYLRGELIAQAGRPTKDEWLARVRTRRGGSMTFEDAVSYIRADRDSR